MNTMYEVYIKKLLALAEQVSMDSGKLMIAGGSDILHFSAIALILVLLTARIARRKRGRFSQSFLARNTQTKICVSDLFFELEPNARQKPCPNCAEQLSTSALICNACDYNFLAARPLRGQQLLPPPLPHTVGVGVR